MYSYRGTVARIAALVLIVGGFTVMQGNTEPAHADGQTVQRGWSYTNASPVDSAPVQKWVLLTYSPTDSPYDAVRRECARQGQTTPTPGSDLERIVGGKPDFFVPRAEGGYAAAAYMLIAEDPLFASRACANGSIQWR